MTKPVQPSVLEMEMTPKEQALPATVQTLDPQIQMIRDLAADKDFDVNKLQAIVAMLERGQDRLAAQQFNEAFARMQPKIPIIGEKSKTDKGTYAPREDIVEVVTPILAEFGFALSFKTTFPEAGKLKITGKLKHVGGHCEESEFLAEADQSGSKNAIQARGSTVEYGRRYTTCDLLNIATRKADDDGKKAGLANAPEGWEAWLKSMHTAAKKGSATLNAAWQCSEPVFQKYITHFEWEAIKQAAKDADRSIPRA